MNRTPTRRHFLQAGAALVASTSLPAPSILLGGLPSRTLNFASVGSGGKGWGDIQECSKGHRVVAVCDVDHRRLARSVKQYPGTKGYVDWRRLLEQPGIDAVTISTPDHMHAPVAMEAMDRGLHVYVQKPLAHDIYEARQMQERAREKKVVTQMGNQGHSSSTYQTLVKAIHGGIIGKVREAHAWSNRPIWPQGMTTRPALVGDQPTGVSWDHWLGTAPFRAYAADVYHAFKWRGWVDFGTGALGDMGCHILDPVVWALDLGAPESVEAEGPGVTQEAYPEWGRVHYDFPASSQTAGSIRVTWHDGGKMPPHDDEKLFVGVEKFPRNGCLFHGERGSLLSHHGGGDFYLLPRSSFDRGSVERVPEKNHYQEFTRAILGETKTTSHFDYACPLTETVLLGNLALRFPGKKLAWSAADLKVTNHEAANRFIRRKYREGWEVKGL